MSRLQWHLGGNTVGVTPTGRGFLSHRGYLSGALDYETHLVDNTYDFFNGLRPDVASNGTFSTRIFASAASDIIAAHAAGADGGAPLFLYLAFQNVHWPLEAPGSATRTRASVRLTAWPPTPCRAGALCDDQGARASAHDERAANDHWHRFYLWQLW